MLIVCDQPVSTEASLQTSRCQKVLSHARCIHPPLTIDTDAGLVCFFFFLLLDLQLEEEEGWCLSLCLTCLQ